MVVIDWKGTFKTDSACTFALVFRPQVMLLKTFLCHLSTLDIQPQACMIWLHLPPQAAPTALTHHTPGALAISMLPKQNQGCSARGPFVLVPSPWSLFPQ